MKGRERKEISCPWEISEDVSRPRGQRRYRRDTSEATYSISKFCERCCHCRGRFQRCRRCCRAGQPSIMRNVCRWGIQPRTRAPRSLLYFFTLPGKSHVTFLYLYGLIRVFTTNIMIISSY